MSVVHPGTDETITTDNLSSDGNLRRLFTDMAETFADLPPLDLGLVVMLDMGVANETGLISAVRTSIITSVPDAQGRGRHRRLDSRRRAPGRVGGRAAGRV